MANINDFKSRLAGGGARANQFRVILPPPVGQVTAFINTEQFAFLCRSASLPGQTLAEIAIPFRGRTLYVAGERTFELGQQLYLTIQILVFVEKLKDG